MEIYWFKNRLLIFILLIYMQQTDTTSSIQLNKLASYSIPENRELKKALGYNEDTYLNFTELATKYKYATEQHTVTTEDGYILSVFRLLSQCKDRIKPYPVLLMHGIVDTSDVWILAGPKISLGFLLTKNCYDVWAANHRGNFYSRRHIRLNPDKDPQFWNYSFDEHGNYDIPAFVDYILQSTKKSQVYYIGHSQGTTDGLAMNCLKAEYNDKIRLSIYLSPIAFMKHIVSPFPLIGAYSADLINKFLESARISEVFAKDNVIHNSLEFICTVVPKLCEVGLSFSTGHKPGSIKLETLSVAFGHLLSGDSVKTLYHLAQLIVTGRFQRYDEGRDGNMKRYGVPNVPEYNLSLVTSPVVLVSARNDWVSSLIDVNILASKLPNLVENYVVPEPYWSHHNHVWGIGAPVFVNTKILDYLRRFNN